MRRTRVQTRRVGCLLALICAVGSSAHAERLPVTIYSIADGLPNNNVFRVLRDSRGFVWFATREGLSRFDGYTFTNYDEDDGLPSAIINDVIETRDGVYLVGTTRGLARLDTSGLRAQVFVPNVLPSRDAADAGGRQCCGHHCFDAEGSREGRDQLHCDLLQIALQATSRPTAQRRIIFREHTARVVRPDPHVEIPVPRL